MFSEIVAGDVTNHGVYRLRAFARKAQGNLRGAIEDISEAIELCDEPDYLFNRGRWLLEVSDWSTAESDFTKVIDISREAGSVWYRDACLFLRAIARFHLGCFDGVRDDLSAVPDDTAFWTLGRLRTKYELASLLPGG